MEFFIKKNANLPVLKLYLIKDGRSDFQNPVTDFDNASISFSMYDVKTGIIKIAQQPCEIVTELDMDGVSLDYVVTYKFTTIQTSTVGRYKVEFVFNDSTGALILPLRQELFINIGDSISELGFCCS
jgi:hypothetical protein